MKPPTCVDYTVQCTLALGCQEPENANKKMHRACLRWGQPRGAV